MKKSSTFSGEGAELDRTDSVPLKLGENSLKKLGSEKKIDGSAALSEFVGLKGFLLVRFVDCSLVCQQIFNIYTA